MSVQLLQTMSLAAFILAGILFLVAIALFFLFNIPKVFGEVTGSTARKSIENIRQQNERTGNKAYKPSTVNAERGKITEKITPHEESNNKSKGVFVSVGTEKLQTKELERGAQETTILSVPAGETTILSTEESQSSENEIFRGATNNGFSIEYEIGFTGSSEVIE